MRNSCMPGLDRLQEPFTCNWNRAGTIRKIPPGLNCVGTI